MSLVPVSIPRLPAVSPFLITPSNPTAITSLPLSVDLNLYQGDDFWLTLTVTDVNGNPVDMTAYAPAAQIRPNPGGIVVATFTATTSGNNINLHLPHLQSMLLQRKAVWDCQITDSAGEVTTLVSGRVLTTLEVTQ